MVKKIAEWVGFVSHRDHGPTATVDESQRSRGPVTGTYSLPGGKSMEVIRRDTFERAIGRARETA